MLACSLLIGGCSKDIAPAVMPSTTPITSITITTSASSSSSSSSNENVASKTSLHIRPDVEPNGDIVILMTGDTHSRYDTGFSYGGVYEVRYQHELKGDTVMLVDDGDAIQGGPLGFDTKGAGIIEFMNAMDYDVAIPGVHEFHYGVDRFNELREMANFEYISCNFTKNGELVLSPYLIKEVCGKDIAFVGVTTPKAITQAPEGCFQDANGDYIYGFMQDETGEAIIKAVQNSIDKARAEGADYVILMGHIGNDEAADPWVYTTITSRIHGCDAYFDGYSHDTKAEEYMDAEGKTHFRVSAGSGMRGIGWVRIAGKNGKVTAGVYSWQNKLNPMDFFDFDNPMSRKVNETKAKMSGK